MQYRNDIALVNKLVHRRSPPIPLKTAEIRRSAQLWRLLEGRHRWCKKWCMLMTELDFPPAVT